MSRRKPILQIGGRNLNRNTPDEPTLDSSSSFGGLGLVEDYGAHSSGDEHDVAINKEDKLNDESADTKLADFLKEIGDIETKQAEDSTAKEEFEINWGAWTQCIDENTNHPYYWNTETNEVTWTVPDEITQQYENTSPKTEHSLPCEKQENGIEKKSINLEENVLENAKEKSPELEKENLKNKLQSNKEYLISKTSLKSAILQNQKKQEKIKEKERNSPVATKENYSMNFEFDIDAELDSALTSKNKTKSKDEESYSFATKRRKILKKDLLQLTNYPGSSSESDTSEDVKKRKMNDVRTEKPNKIFDDDDDSSGSDQEMSKYDMGELEEGEIESRSPLPQPVANFNIFPRKFVDKSTQVDNNQLKTSTDHKEKIEEISETLLSKLEYFAMAEANSSSFYKLITEVEVRLKDWKADELSDNYVLNQLNITTTQVDKHEKSFLPDEWSCFWDSEQKKYYFKKEGESVGQWELPIKPTVNSTETNENGENSTTSTTNQIQPDGYHPGYSDNHAHHPMPMNYGYNMNYQQYWNQYNMQQPYNTSMNQYSEEFQPNSDNPPPPPGEETAPLPPSEDSNPPPPPPPGDSQPPLPVSRENSPALGPPENDGMEMEISDGEEKETTLESVSRPVAQLKKGPVEYQASALTVQSNKVNVKRNESLAKIKKAKKSKREKSIPKKPGKMVGMVMKWQRAKMEIEEEEKRLIQETEEEFKVEGDVGKQIQKWKTEQILSGKATTNANFEPVSSDWRKKIQDRKKLRS